jgi:LacI family transcriptional regulator
LSNPDLQPVTTVALAKHLGISASTVSIVLRGEAGRRKIAPQTVERVLKAARDLNYVPNQWARNLRRQRSGMIGVILASFRWDWAQELIRGMSEVFEPCGHTPFVAAHMYHPDWARREFSACLQRRDEAILMVPLPGLDDVYAQARNMRVPVVFVGDRPATLPDAHFVAWDSPTDTRLAVRHLIEIGRKRIGFIGFDYPMPLNLARYESYRSVLKEAGLPANEQWISRSPMMLPPAEIVEQSIVRLFESGHPKPDALFVQHDGLAIVLLDALMRRGIRVPQEVAVVGMGDYPITRHAGIGLSTVKEPIEEIGRQSAQIALDLLKKVPDSPIQRLLPCGELKARRTTVTVQ